MTLKQLALVGPAGTAVTLANSGADRVIATNGSTIVYDDALGVKLGLTSGGTTAVGLNMAAGNKQFAFSGEFTTPATVPSSGFVSLGTIKDSTGTTLVGIGYTSAKKIILVGAAGAILVLSKTGSGADGTMEPATSFRVAGVVTIGTSSTTGAFAGHIYPPGISTTALFSPTPVTNVNLGTTTPTEFRAGVDSGPGVNILGGRYLQINDGATTEPSAWVAGVAVGAVVNVAVNGESPTEVGSDGSLVVTWDPVANADHYSVEWAPGANATTGWVTINPAVSGVEISGLAAGLYTVRVRAKAAA